MYFIGLVIIISDRYSRSIVEINCESDILGLYTTYTQQRCYNKLV